MLVFPLPELVFMGSMQVVLHQPKYTEDKKNLQPFVNTELGIRNGEMEHVDGSGESPTKFH